MTTLPPILPDALGLNFLLLGAPGSGKTTSIPTLLKAGLEVFVIFTEQGVNNLKKACRLHDLTEEEMARLHWTYINPSRGSFAGLAKAAKELSRTTEFGKMAAGNRKDFTQFMDLLNSCASFVDQHGEDFGTIDEWDATRCLVVDGLSGLNDMSMSLIVGDKPVKTLQDWGVAIDTLDKFLKQCCNCVCHFGVLGHLEKETDEVTGRMVVTASTLGRKLGTTIGRHFQEVILTEKGKRGHTFSTEDSRIELKNSYLPSAAGMDASFVPMIEAWLEENK